MSEGKVRELHIEQRFISKILDTIDALIIVLDVEGRLVHHNAACERLTGINFSEMTKFPIWDYLIPVDEVEYVKNVVNSLGNGQSHLEAENHWITKTGDTRLIKWSSTVTLDQNGHVEFIVSSGIDITEQKLAQDEIARLDRLDLIGQMGAGIGHEVRNPMTTVKGFLQFLGDKQEYAKDKEYFELMIDEIDRANSIITEFLSIAGTKSTSLTVCNLNKMIKRIYPLLEAHAYNMNREVIIETSPITDLFLNQREIHQLILNLVRNGLEAVPEGGKVYIRTYTSRSEVVLEIQDNGEGIDPIVLKRIGTPFLTTKPQGTGLGLAVCYGITARHDAKIDIHTGSEGTTFRIRFKKPKKKDRIKEGRP